MFGGSLREERYSVAIRTKKMGVGTFAVGVFDWFARYQTGRDLLASVTTSNIADFLAKPWLSPALVTLGIVLWLMDKKRNGDASDDLPAPMPPVTAKSTVEGSGNSTANATGGAGGSVIQHQHFYPPATIPNKQPEAPKKEPTRFRWSVKFLSVDSVDMSMREDIDTRLMVFREIDHDTGLKGVVVCFRNEPIFGQRAESAENVTGHLILKDENRKEVGKGISKACWLNTPWDMADIDVGESRRLILLACSTGGKSAVPCKVRNSSDDYVNDEAIAVDLGRVRFIEVMLLDSWKNLLLRPLTFEIKLGNGCPSAVMLPS
jgi:hypothetical protein